MSHADIGGEACGVSGDLISRIQEKGRGKVAIRELEDFAHAALDIIVEGKKGRPIIFFQLNAPCAKLHRPGGGHCERFWALTEPAPGCAQKNSGNQ